MSAIPPKADMDERRLDVRFVPKAGIRDIVTPEEKNPWNLPGVSLSESNSNLSVELIVEPSAHDVVGELNVRGRTSGRTQRCRDVECPQVEIEIFQFPRPVCW
jgi:hypothetical protein